MDEFEFDSLVGSQPFGTQDASRFDLNLRRNAALGLALWGKTPEDLRHQLLVPHPEIPAGFNLTDFRELHRYAQALAAHTVGPRSSWLPPVATYSPIVEAGTERFNLWEARSEIVRRAIEYLEKY
jgi:hypothetical protein